MDTPTTDDLLPEHPPADLLDLFVALDEAGVPPEDMHEFATMIAENDAD